MTIDKIIKPIIDDNIFKYHILPYLCNIYLSNEEKDIYLYNKINNIINNKINKLCELNTYYNKKYYENDFFCIKHYYNKLNLDILYITMIKHPTLTLYQIEINLYILKKDFKDFHNKYIYCIDNEEFLLINYKFLIDTDLFIIETNDKLQFDINQFKTEIFNKILK
jgi:hypothetical protein